LIAALEVSERAFCKNILNREDAGENGVEGGEVGVYEIKRESYSV